MSFPKMDIFLDTMYAMNLQENSNQAQKVEVSENARHQTVILNSMLKSVAN